MTRDDDHPPESGSDESAPARERTTPVDADAAFDLLADAERRALLEYLRSDADGTATTDELVETVRRREDDGGRGTDGDSDAETEGSDGVNDAEGSDDDHDAEGSDGRAVARDRAAARPRAAVRVRHKHLPKLMDAGVAEYDQRSETVRYWGNSFLEALLDAGQSAEARWVAERTPAAESANSEAE